MSGPAPADAGTDEWAGAHPSVLRGAAAPGAGITLNPIVSLPTGRIGGAPADGSLPELIALDFDLTWGRDGVLDQLEPSTGRLTVLDTTRRWATSREWIGERVDLGWDAIDRNGLVTSRWFFRGRIDSVKVVRHPIARPDGSTLWALRAEFGLVDVLRELADIVPPADWTYEWVEDGPNRPSLDWRLRRIRSLVGAQLPGGIATVPNANSYVGAIKSDAQVSLWEHLIRIGDGMGLRLLYSPHSQTLSWQPSRDWTNRRAVGQLWRAGTTEGTARDGAGVYVRARQLANTAQTQLYLDGTALDADEDWGVERDATSRINRITVTAYSDIGTGARETRSVDVPGVPTTLGIRAMRVDSAFTFGMNTLGLWSDAAAIDAAAWRVSPFRLDTSRAPFEDVRQVLALVSGYESETVVFLTGTRLPELNVAPVFTVIGGKIGYRDGHWEIEWRPAPIRLIYPQHSIEWENIDAGTTGYVIEWHDDVNARAFHESVTYEDLAYVGRGFAIAEDAADIATSGWDFYTA